MALAQLEVQLLHLPLRVGLAALVQRHLFLVAPLHTLVVAVALVLFLGRVVQVAQVVVARGGQVLLPAPVLLVRLIPAVAVEAVALVLLTLPAAQEAPASSS